LATFTGVVTPSAQLTVASSTITRAEPTTADPDREIVDGWAEKLGLSRWYAWKTP
jgi:hypothetical protein